MLVDPEQQRAGRGSRRRRDGGRPPGARREEERRGRWRSKQKSERTKWQRDLKRTYAKESRPGAPKEFGIENLMAVPRLEKIVLNMGLGEAIANPKMLDVAAEELSSIAGQKAVDHAGEEVDRDLQAAGRACRSAARVTLRGERMYEFLDRLINIALPRVRDFRGVSPQSVRRPGQLHAGSPGSLHLPGDRLRENGQVEGLERDDRDDGGAGRPGPGAPVASSGCRSRSIEERRTSMARRAMIDQGGEEAEVHDADGPALPRLRPAAERAPQVRAVPNLFPPERALAGYIPGVVKATW